MALLTCIKCRESYSDTLNGCPHCGFIPQIFLCPECGSVHGPGDLCCRNCGFQLNGSRIIADDAAIAGALEKLGGELEKVTGLRQAEKLFALLSVMASEPAAAELLQKAHGLCQDLQRQEELARAYARLTGAQPQSPEELAELIALGESLGAYEDAPERTEALRLRLLEERYAAAMALKVSAASAADWQVAADAFGALAGFRDADALRDEGLAKAKELTDRRKKKVRTWVTVAIAAVVAVALIISSILYFIPNYFYNNGLKLSEEGLYGEAAGSFLKAGNYQDAPELAVKAQKAQFFLDGEAAFAAGAFLDAREAFLAAEDHPGAADRAAECVLADHHAQGCALLEQGSFQEALDRFAQAGDYADTAEKTKDARYGLADAYAGEGEALLAVQTFCQVYDHKDAAQRARDIADSLLSDGEFARAAEAYDAIPDSEAAAYASYSRGRAAFLREDYADAALLFGEAGSVEDAPARRTESVYLQGMGLLLAKDYESASVCFNTVRDYADAAGLYTVCTAEQALADGWLNTAIELYKKVPADLTVEGFDIQGRIALVNGASKFAPVCGKFTVTRNYIESRCQYRFGSRWWNWYHDEPLGGQSLTIKCFLNGDGTVDLRGEVTFYRFTSYDYYGNCYATTTTKSFSLTKLTSVPGSITVDYLTKLSRSGSGFLLKYSCRDEGSADFFYTYNSDVTFGNRSTVY